MCQPIQQNKIMGIKSNGLRYGLEHREKETQLLSLSIQGAARDYGQRRRQTRKSSIILFGGLQPHFAYLRRLFSLYWDTHIHSYSYTLLISYQSSICRYAPEMPSPSLAFFSFYSMLPLITSFEILPFPSIEHEPPFFMYVISHLHLSL